MSLADPVLAVSHDLPIRTTKAVHNGKVRSLYWLTDSDSQRLIREKNYDVAKDSALAIMVISDRISAFDCIFHGENNLQGVPGKGVALNAISNHWFKLFQQQELADNHILDIPHPLVWIVQKARPIKIEAIIRQYISGSMWRAYDKGAREFCGITLPDGLIKNQKLPQLLITPSTKGVLSGLAGVPELDDTNICRSDIEAHFQAFGFDTLSDIDKYEELLTQGFSLISNTLATLDQLFVDTKFEFGYVKDKSGCNKLIYMDEVGTPDSSRIWDASAYREGKIVENSKEGFRQMLLDHFPDPDILLNSDRMPERKKLAQEHALPLEMMLSLSRTYTEMAEKITGQALIQIQNPRAEIIHVLGKDYGLID